MKKIAMCPPDHFDVLYAINPWMDPTIKVDKELAKKQYEAIKNLYRELGAEVQEMPAQAGLPDMVFAANPGNPQGNMFVVSNFKHPERREEATFAARYFEERGFEIKQLPQDLFFEGQGDLIWAYEKYFMGYGKRSSAEVAPVLEEMLNVPVIPLQMHDPYFYHLDTCFAPLSSTTVVINPQSFLPEDLRIIRDHFPKVIEANAQDNKAMACNLVVIGNNVVLGEGISDELRKAIEKEEFTVHELPMTEFLKSGGSVKCVTLELW